MEYTIKNITMAQFVGEPLTTESPTLYQVTAGEDHYDFLINYVAGSEMMVVLGSGTVERSKPLPVFQRISWAEKIPCTSVWFSDPSLYTGSLALYWCYGDKEHWYLERIAFLIQLISHKLQIPMERTCFFGSSGGGYASIVLATLLRSRAAVINPQFILPNYLPVYYKRWYKAVIGEEGEAAKERLYVYELFVRERYLPRLLCLENSLSLADIKDQLSEFLTALCEKEIPVKDTISVEFFSRPGGHSAMPTQARSLEVMLKVLNSTQSGIDLDLPDAAETPRFYDRIAQTDLDDPAAYLNFFPELAAQSEN